MIEIAPGVDLQKDILDQMDFTPAISKDLKEMDPALFSEQWGGLKEIIDEKAKAKVQKQKQKRSKSLSLFNEYSIESIILSF